MYCDPCSQWVLDACTVLVGCIFGLSIAANVISFLSWVSRGLVAWGRTDVVGFLVGVFGTRGAPAWDLLLGFLVIGFMFDARRRRSTIDQNFALFSPVRVWVPRALFASVPRGFVVIGFVWVPRESFASAVRGFIVIGFVWVPRASFASVAWGFIGFMFVPR